MSPMRCALPVLCSRLAARCDLFALPSRMTFAKRLEKCGRRCMLRWRYVAGAYALPCVHMANHGRNHGHAGCQSDGRTVWEVSGSC